MDISAVNAATSAYSAMNQNSKAAMTNQSSNVAQTTQADSVNLSPEAIASQRQEKYQLKNNPIDLFLEWKEKDIDTINLGSSLKGNGELLAENVEFIAQLEDAKKSASTLEEKMSLEANIATVKRYGYEEIFTSISDIHSRLQAEAESASLQANYLLEKNGKLSFDLTEMKINTPSLSEITGIHDTPVFEKDIASEEYLANFDNSAFLTELLTRIYSGTNKNEIGIILPDMN